MSLPVVALIGRPNVGKSAYSTASLATIARSSPKRRAPTRDRHFAKTDWAGRSFWLVDTGE